jgi:serine protease Do
MMRTDDRSRFSIRCLILLGAFVTFGARSDSQGLRADEESGKKDSNSASNSVAEVPIERKTAKAKELSDAFRAAAEKGLPSVVTVYARRVEKGEENEVELLELLEDPSDNHNIGSGVIITPEGLIVTNHHVVDKCNRVRVRLPDGREYLGTDIKSDKSSDLAILSIAPTKKLSHVTLGDSDTASVGDWVLAIGSPFAIEQTVSAGIISGKSRGMRDLVAGQLLQTDAAINPGNSGGALLNLDGELIGINSAIASTSGVFEGVGFAIPVNRVKWIISELRANGRVRRATMGATVASLPAEVAEQLELPVRSGALVVSLRADSPAEKAGLKKGDVILKLADQTVRSHLDLNAIVEQLPVEQPQSLDIMREGKRIELTISLKAKRE